VSSFLGPQPALQISDLPAPNHRSQFLKTHLSVCLSYCFCFSGDSPLRKLGITTLLCLSPLVVNRPRSFLVLASQSCPSKLPQTGGFTTGVNKPPPRLEATSPRSRCHGAMLPPEALGANPSCLFQLLEAPAVPRLVATLLQSLDPCSPFPHCVSTLCPLALFYQETWDCI